MLALGKVNDMLKYIEQFNVNNFRGLKNLHLSDLSNINIIAGINNCGKTSLLEAIKVVQTPNNCENLVKVADSRGAVINNFQKFIRIVASLYNQDDVSEEPTIEISFKLNDESFTYESTIEQTQKVEFASDNPEISNKRSRFMFQDSLRIVTKCKSDKSNKSEYNTYDITEENVSNVSFGNTTGLFNCLYLGVALNLYASCTRIISQTILENRKEEFIKTLQYFDPSITDISIIDDDIYIHALNHPVMPLYTFGAGTQRSLLLVGVIYMARGGILLVDEIDTGLHLSIFEDVFTNLVRLCMNLNVQLFVTTHSIECIDSLVSCATKQGLGKVTRMITLKKVNDETVSRTLDGNEALISRENYHIELRQ